MELKVNIIVLIEYIDLYFIFLNFHFFNFQEIFLFLIIASLQLKQVFSSAHEGNIRLLRIVVKGGKFLIIFS